MLAEVGVELEMDDDVGLVEKRNRRCRIMRDF